MDDDNKVYFHPGDTVVLKQKLEMKPVMIVKSKDTVSEVGGAPRLLGITCMWFSTNMELQTARFNTKDLDHVE